MIAIDLFRKKKNYDRVCKGKSQTESGTEKKLIVQTVGLRCIQLRKEAYPVFFEWKTVLPQTLLVEATIVAREFR